MAHEWAYGLACGSHRHRATALPHPCEKGFEDAIREGIAKAAETVRNIKAAWVKEQRVVVEGGKITGFRVDLKITFVLD
jgi:dodecin